ncbi:MAG: 3'-5' exonuclease [Flavobacteriales bacterium]|nr:3'-5' exonuclease [Flavobacteriales bacterium]
MRLQLLRPLAVFDLETTGVRIGQDRIVQIGLIRIHPDGSRDEFESLVRPGIPIPPEATAVHGITDADVANAPALEDLAEGLLDRLKDCDLGGFNCLRFDVPFLSEELFRIGREWDTSSLRIVDVQRIYHKMEPRNLSAAVQFYTGGSHEAAHDAMADVKATADVLLAQLEKYQDLPTDVDGLGEFSGDRSRSPDAAGKLAFDQNGQICLSFGKYRGWPLVKIGQHDPGYLQWLMTKADLPGSTLAIMRNSLSELTE